VIEVSQDPLARLAGQSSLDEGGKELIARADIHFKGSFFLRLNKASRRSLVWGDSASSFIKKYLQCSMPHQAATRPFGKPSLSVRLFF
jgi:hypothetical protein